MISCIHWNLFPVHISSKDPIQHFFSLSLFWAPLTPNPKTYLIPAISKASDEIKREQKKAKLPQMVRV